eukprot:8595034-Pyramimonas_sp.AAC.1
MPPGSSPAPQGHVMIKWVGAEAWAFQRSMRSTTTNGLKRGIKMASQMIKGMSDAGERGKHNL